MFNWTRLMATVVLALMGVSMSVAEIYTLDRARELYNEGLYEEAAPTFAKELKRKSNDGNLNFCYGVCLYETGSCEEAVKYLEKATSRKVDEGYLYLGRTYTAMWKFDEAVVAYEEYITLLEDDEKEPDAEVEREYATAKIGERMMRGVEQVQIIDSIAVDSASFFEAYRLSPESGRLLSPQQMPKIMQDDTISLAYLPQRGDVLYMGYCVNGNYDLYQSHTLIDKTWSEPQSLSETLNNADNQSYPFLLSDGLTLYYAQDGESSLGGYDIYITMYNAEREDYMLPQNVGMPFNSPDNDYMMAIDETLGVGWWVTDRNHIPGKLTIYIYLLNDTKQVYRDVEESRLISLARIDSISATWEEGADYSQWLDAIANVEVAETTEIDREFYFVVCNGMIYTHFKDFKSPEALQFFNQARTAQRHEDEMRNELDDLRKRYEVGNGQTRALLTERILQLEAEMLEDAESAEVYENRAREAELLHLNLLTY